MEYYERERIIAECRKKLPYPMSFYDKLSDGSLWNVYNKHVVNDIPINKKGMKAKAANDEARKREAEAKANNQPQDIYEQITMEEYMEAMQPKKPAIVKSQNGCWWRLNDGGTYDWIPDSELDDVLEAFGIVEPDAEEPVHEQQGPVKRLVRTPAKPEQRRK